jgi:O-antigen/teichoic acid export membrane protein
MPALETENTPVVGRWKFLSIDEAALQQGREYASTFLTEFAVMASQILVYKLAAHYLGKQGFSEYSVARRTNSLTYPIVLLGLGVALPRYIGHTRRTGKMDPGPMYYGAALRCVLCALTVAAMLMNALPKKFAFVFFGDATYSPLVFPLTLMMTGLTVHTVIYGYFRGQLAMDRANLLQFMNFGIAPIVAFLLFHRDLRSTLLGLGLLFTLVAGVALFFTPWKQVVFAAGKDVKELLRYGLQRLPADFGQLALLTLPAIFVTHFQGIREGGFVAFSISVLTMMGAVFAPIGIVLLPKASQMLADNRYEELRSHVRRISWATGIVAVGMTLALEAFARPLIRLYLGSGYEEVASLIQLLGLGIVPDAAYCSLRSLIDAHHAGAMNTLNNGIALAAFLLCSATAMVLRIPNFIPIALLLSLIILGCLTAFETRSILRN